MTGWEKFNNSEVLLAKIQPSQWLHHHRYQDTNLLIYSNALPSSFTSDSTFIWQFFLTSQTFCSFWSAPSTLFTPLLISSLHLGVCVLTGQCHAGADLWAVSILPCQDRLFLEYQCKHIHIHRDSSIHMQVLLHIPVTAPQSSYIPAWNPVVLNFQERKTH